MTKDKIDKVNELSSELRKLEIGLSRLNDGFYVTVKNQCSFEVEIKEELVSAFKQMVLADYRNDMHITKQKLESL